MEKSRNKRIYTQGYITTDIQSGLYRYSEEFKETRLVTESKICKRIFFSWRDLKASWGRRQPLMDSDPGVHVAGGAL
jgi:hypothetical protein